MSWNKNTVGCSSVDRIVATLNNLGIPYSLSVMASVRGYGLNDTEDATYELRRLECGRFVLLERIERTSDCDTDDIICSYPFDFQDEPLDWQYEIMEVNS